MRSVRKVVPAPIRRRVRRTQAKLRLLDSYGAPRRHPLLSLNYLLAGRELDNFTYEIDNRSELAAMVAGAFDVDAAQALKFIREIDEDAAFRAVLTGLLAGRRDRPEVMAPGRRLGWYASVRLAKPKLVVETGVHDGFGSALLLRALERNVEDGVEGQLLSFDIRSDVGWLVPAHLRSRHQMVIGDSLALIPRALDGRQVDLFVHDSDHRYEHEMAELELIRPLTSPRAALLSDNVHACTAFVDFCRAHNLRPHVFIEQPVGHIYPGAGLGLCLNQPAPGSSDTQE